jgi:selenide, water dikinase
LRAPNDPRVLIDYRTSDDAGVYRLDSERSLVQTVDFFTPIVDDPFVYGQIAAANALSDVYAMGARPLTALAVATFPKDADPGILATIFKGGLAKLAEAGVALLGGHTVQDTEIKFGYAVTGDVLTAGIWSNAGARPGDELFLTKPLGTGIVSTALKFDRAPADVIETAIRSMTTLNGVAADALRALPPGAVHGCTDVTGFGLIGHATEMAAASGCTLAFESEAIPLLAGVRALVRGNIPGGGRTNAQHFGPGARLSIDLDPDLVQLLYDPQTSGGLLIAIAPEQAGQAAAALHAGGVLAARVGRVLEPTDVRVTVTSLRRG